MITLRPYQSEAVARIREEWEMGHLHTLCVMATGLGKTITFAAIAEKEVCDGHRVLILAHRGELLEQAADKIRTSVGLTCSIEKADQTCRGTWNRVTVGSIQSLQQPKRLESFPPDYWDTIIIDEAHHVLSDGYRRVIDYFSGARLLGVTATPDRGDMRSLSEVFESCAFEYGIDKGVKDGYLCKITAETIPLQIDLGDVKQQNGDFAVGDLGDALEPYLEGIATEMAARCQDRKTVVFLPLIRTSQKFRDILQAHGLSAAEVNGQSPDRAEILADFAAGKYQVLCNSMLLTEGWDCPSVNCIVVLRPTKVRSLYVQMVGRGLRLHPGKDNCLLLDFLWQTSRHDLVHPASMLAKSQEIADQATEILADEDGQQMDLLEVLDQAETDVVRQREEALARQLAEMRRRKHKLVDPLQYVYSIGGEDLADYEPTMPAEMAPPSKSQLEMLEKRGINPDTVTCAGQASYLIDKLIKRQRAGLATPKQIRFLEGKGFVHVGEWQFDAARSMIDQIAGNNWRVPHHIYPPTYTPAAPAHEEVTELPW